MFENKTCLHFQPGKFDEGMLVLRTYILPILRSQKGLLSLAVIPQPSQNFLYILSLWKSAAHAQKTESSCEYRREIKRLDSFICDPPSSPPDLVMQHFKPKRALNMN